jgi:hypothetical protein
MNEPYAPVGASPEPAQWTVVVNVRQVGAIGVWYEKTFTFAAPADATRDQCRDAWLAPFGTDWETRGFHEFHRTILAK